MFRETHPLFLLPSTMQTKMILKEETMPLLKGNDGPIARSSCSQTVLLKNNDAQATKRKLIFACTLAFFFFITEVTAGYLANSLGRIGCEWQRH
jgi:hypothetical protein